MHDQVILKLNLQIYINLLSGRQNTLCDRMSVRPSVISHDNLRTRWRRMMKLGTNTLEVKSNMEFEDGSRTLPLTRSN